MPAKKSAKRPRRPDPARAKALARWARYRAELKAAEAQGKAILQRAEFTKGGDRLWSVKSEIGSKKIQNAGFRTKTGARLWLRERSRAFVQARRAKALSALPSRDKTIARAFETPD